MRKRYKGGYRHPRTTAEKRANQDGEFVRGRRKPHLLPSSYDDIYVKGTKSWKDKRLTQYRDKPRGKKHEIIIKGQNYIFLSDWRLQDYLEKYDIPYRLEPIRENFQKSSWVTTKREKWYLKPRFCYSWNPDKRHQIGFDWVYRDVPLDKPYKVVYTYSRQIGTKIVWWSDKDIGIDYILNQVIK